MSAVIIAAFAFTGCKKEEKKPADAVGEQKITAIYFGGTWCPPCGANGKPAKENLKTEFGNKVNIISCQINGSTPDPMNNADANAFAQVFGVRSVPTMFLGGGNGLIASVGGSSSMSASCITKGNEIKGLTAVASCDASLSLSGDNLTINTTTKFYADQPEEYFIAAYITENGLNYVQASDGSAHKDMHDFVIRSKASLSITGDLISNNNKKGDSKTKTFNTVLNSTWNKSNLYVTSVIWRKNPDGLVTICNSSSKKLN